MALPRFTWTTQARPFLELGIGDSRVAVAAARWDVQRWDQPDAVWSGVEPFWQDVTCEAYQVGITVGRERTTDRFEVGTMTVVAANVSGWADLQPPAPGDINTLMLRPGRAIRFGVDHVTQGRVVLFRGFIDVVDPVYEPGSDVVNLQCVDALGEVGKVRLTDPVETGDGEYVHTRLGRILDVVQWPPEKRDIAGSSIALLAAKIDGQAADLLGQTSDSAGGAVFGDTNGSVAYRAADWQMWQTSTAPDATIGNVAADDVCPTRWQRPYSRAEMSNVIILGNVRQPTADVVSRSDSSSWGLYGIETFERTDLATQDVAQLALMADRYLATRGANTIPRVRTVSFDARTADNVVDLLTSSSCYRPSRYRCRLALERGLIFDQQHYCTGANHDISPDGWTSELLLDIADPYAATNTPRWEPASGADAGLSRWDRVAWN